MKAQEAPGLFHFQIMRILLDQISDVCAKGFDKATSSLNDNNPDSIRERAVNYAVRTFPDWLIVLFIMITFFALFGAMMKFAFILKLLGVK